MTIFGYEIGSIENHSNFLGIDFAQVENRGELSLVLRKQFYPKQRITRIQDDLTIDLQTEAKVWLGIQPSNNGHDAIVTLLLVVAMQMADNYCNNPFEEFNETSCVFEPYAIPDAVKVGVLQILRHLYDDFLEASNGGSSAGGGVVTGNVTKEKAGDIEVQYSSGGAATANTSIAQSQLVIPHLARNILKQYRLQAGT